MDKKVELFLNELKKGFVEENGVPSNYEIHLDRSYKVYHERDLNEFLDPDAYVISVRKGEYYKPYVGSIDKEKFKNDIQIVESEKNYTFKDENVYGWYSPQSRMIVVRKETIRKNIENDWKSITRNRSNSDLLFNFFEYYEKEKDKIDIEKAVETESLITKKHELAHAELFKNNMEKYDLNIILPKKLEFSLGEFFDQASEVAADFHPKGPVNEILKFPKKKRKAHLSYYMFQIGYLNDINRLRIMTDFLHSFILYLKEDEEKNLKRLKDSVKSVNESLDRLIEITNKLKQKKKEFKLIKEIDRLYPINKEFKNSLRELEKMVYK